VKTKSPLAYMEPSSSRFHRHILWGRVLIGLGLIGGWELFTRLGVMDAYYWSSPSLMIETAILKFQKGTLLYDIGYTSAATLLGFILGTLTGAMLGLSFWWGRRYAGIMEPYLVILNALPKLALAPVLVILFGIGFPSKVILAFSMTVITAALSAFSGVKSVDSAMETLLYSLGASRWQVFVKIAIPWAMPWIISSLRVNIALALAGTIVGEFIASSHGVGRMIIYAGTTFDIDLVWVGVVILSLLSILMYGGVVWLEKWLSRRLTIVLHE